VEGYLRSSLRRAALLSVSTAAKQLFHTNTVINQAELCVKSNFDPLSAPPRACRTDREAGSKPVDGSPRILRVADQQQIDRCEKWRLEVSKRGANRLLKGCEESHASIEGEHADL
jgi:hypothetical protein